jgi:hypothetical protein
MTNRYELSGDEDTRISLLTAYVVGLEGILARLAEPEGKAVFLSSSDFAAGLVRLTGDAIADGRLPAAARAQNQPIHKNFHDGWPSLTIPSTMDLIMQRGSFIEWMMQNENALLAHFKGTAVAPQFPHHLDALYEGLGVIERHRGDTRNIRPTKDDRARTAAQKMRFDFGMR